jgi:hypothetical protein
MSSYPYTTKLPECASDISMPADPDNDGYDSEDEEQEYPYGHEMTLQQGINGATEPDEEAYVTARAWRWIEA